MQLNYRQKTNGMYILSRKNIEQIATTVLEEYCPRNLTTPTALDTRDFLENFLGLTVKHKYIGNYSSGILGLIVMNDIVEIPSYDEMLKPTVLEETFGTVLITPQLLSPSSVSRRRYTEMHEGSHFLLHQPYYQNYIRMIGEKQAFSSAYIACRKVERYKERQKSDGDWMEYQADALAAAPLMPEEVFCSCARAKMRKYGIYAGCLYVGPFSDGNQISSIVSETAQMFGVSYRAAQIRMLHMELVRVSTLHC